MDLFQRNYKPVASRDSDKYLSYVAKDMTTLYNCELINDAKTYILVFCIGVIAFIH